MRYAAAEVVNQRILNAPKHVNHAETVSAIQGRSVAILVAVSVHQLVDFAPQKSAKASNSRIGDQGLVGAPFLGTSVVKIDLHLYISYATSIVGSTRWYDVPRRPKRGASVDVRFNRIPQRPSRALRQNPDLAPMGCTNEGELIHGW